MTVTIEIRSTHHPSHHADECLPDPLEFKVSPKDDGDRESKLSPSYPSANSLGGLLWGRDIFLQSLIGEMAETVSARFDFHPVSEGLKFRTKRAACPANPCDSSIMLI